MDATMLVYALLFLPLIACLGYRTRNAHAFSIIAGVLMLGISAFLYLSLPLVGTFYITKLTWVFVTMICVIYLFSALYSHDYFKGKHLGMSIGMFYALMNIFVCTMLFSLVINDYGLMWVGIEATTVSSALLIMTEKSEASMESAWRYIILVSEGVLFAFISIILIYYSFHTLTISQVLSMPSRYSTLVEVAVAIALVGLGTKIGIFPMHAWLPDAHSEAPAPVSALFSGVLLPTALYVLYMIYQIAPPTLIYMGFAIASVAAASIFLTYQRSYKRMFAYSSMENMAMALLGLSLGGIGILGAVIVVAAHSLGKAGAFYSSGNVFSARKEKMIDKISGLWASMKGTASSLMLSSFAVTGAPPFGTFVGELLIFIQMLDMHLYIEFAIVVFFLAAAFIAVNYNISKMVFDGEDKERRESPLMSGIALTSAVLSLLVGIAAIVVMI